MNKIDKIVAPAFKVALIVYVLSIVFRNEFRPDIYMIVTVPLEYCLGILLIYLGARWATGKVRAVGSNSPKHKAVAILTLFGTILVLLVVSILGEYLLRGFSVTREALMDLQNSKEGRAALGVPIRPGWLIGVQIQMKGGDGAAALSIPVEGSRAGGNLEVTAARKDGLWRVVDLDLITDHSKSVIHVSH